MKGCLTHRLELTRLTIAGDHRPHSRQPSANSRWGLEDYRKLVRKHQGNQIQIVETTDESEIVPRLLKALGDIT